MVVYDLDRNESIDTVKVNGIEYRLGDVPKSVQGIMMDVKVSWWEKLKGVKLVDKWRPVVKKYLEVFNKDVNIEHWDDGQVFQLISILYDRLR